MSTPAIDYDKLAQQYGGQPASGNLDDLAKQYGGSAATPATAPQSPGILKGIQQNVDSTLNAPPTEPGWRGEVQNFGQHAARTLLAPVIHPVETLKNIADPLESMSPSSIHNFAEGVNRDYQAGGMPRLASSALGTGAGMAAQGGLLGAAGASGRGMQRGGAALDNAIIGTKMSTMERGGNPGAALSNNRIVGSTPSSLLSQVKDEIPEAANAHRASIVANTRPGTTINAGPIVSNPFTARIADATNPVTGVAMPAQIGRANLVQRLLTHVPDESTGQPTPMMRNPNLSPIDATNLKSSIYGMTDYENPFKSTIANAALKDAAHGLKTSVEQAVPESLPFGQALHNLMAAKDTLIPQAQGTKLIPASKSGLIDRATTLGGTGMAAGMHVLGSGLQHVPVAAPLVLTSAALARNQEREKEDREKQRQ
jgi:hypothetical protein